MYLHSEPNACITGHSAVTISLTFTYPQSSDCGILLESFLGGVPTFWAAVRLLGQDGRFRDFLGKAPGVYVLLFLALTYSCSTIAVPRNHRGKRLPLCLSPRERISPVLAPEYQGDGRRFPLRRIKLHERKKRPKRGQNRRVPVTFQLTGSFCKQFILCYLRWIKG
jgi:hypothetical protein